MTKEEISKKTQGKIEAILTLQKQLEITASAETVLSDGGLIKQVIYYTDNEKYPMDEPKNPSKQNV